MKIGVVYYSRTGNTRQVAKVLEGKFKEKNAEVDLFEIEHVKRPGFFTAGRAAVKQLELPMKNIDVDFGKYDVIVAGSPTWAGNPSPFLTFFMKKNASLKGKKVAVFATGRSPIDSRERFNEMMRNIRENAGATPVGTNLALQFKRGNLADGQQNIDSFIDTVLTVKK
jgi:flavodoxin